MIACELRHYDGRAPIGHQIDPSINIVELLLILNKSSNKNILQFLKHLQTYNECGISKAWIEHAIECLENLQDGKYFRNLFTFSCKDLDDGTKKFNLLDKAIKDFLMKV